MELLLIFTSSLVLGAMLHLFIKNPFLAGALSVTAVTAYHIIVMLNAPYVGGASMWPIAAFFIAIFSTAGAGLGVFIVFALRKRNE